MKGYECLHCECVVDTWIGVNCEKSDGHYGKETNQGWEGCILMTGVLLCLADISAVFQCAHCDGRSDDVDNNMEPFGPSSDLYPSPAPPKIRLIRIYI